MYGFYKRETKKIWKNKHKKVLQKGNRRVIIRRVSESGQHFIGMSPSGKAPDFDSGIRRFKSCHPSHLTR